MAASNETVFLTGGTGVLGRRLAVLLAGAGHVVHLLVRPGSRRRAREWLSDLRIVDPGAAGRILLLSGDLTEDGILDQSARTRVLEDAGSIIHCAAATAPVGDHSLAWATNVEGTGRMLALAEEHEQLRTFLYVSDLAVAGDHRGTFGEGDLLCNQRFSGTYAQSKLLAERRVRASSSRLPVRVVRLGSLVGQARGEGQLDGSALYAVLDGLIRLGRLPQGLRRLPLAPLGSCARVDLLPADWAAQAVHHLWRTEDLEGMTFQLADPDAPSVGEFLSFCCRHLGVRGPYLEIPRRPWTALCEAGHGAGLNGLFEDWFGLSEERLSRSIRCSRPDTSASDRALRSGGLTVPHFSDYLGGVLEYLSSNPV